MLQTLIHLLNPMQISFLCGALAIGTSTYHRRHQPDATYVKSLDTLENRKMLVIGNLYRHYRRDRKLLENKG